MNNYDDGYFIKNIIDHNNPLPELNRLQVSMGDISNLKISILRIISESKTYLKVCSFIISDTEIFESLYRKIVDENISVFILTSLSTDAINNDYLPSEETSKDKRQNHFKYIRVLFQSGAHIRAAGNIHSKFIISDSSAIIMSANLTKYSLNLNPESGIIISDKLTHSALEHLFELIFLKGSSYSGFKSKKNRAIIESKLPTITNEELSGINSSSLVYTYESKINLLYTSIIELIKKSNQFILIATYSIIELTKIPEFLQAIEDAKKRNVEIRFFCRAMNHRSDHLKSCSILSTIGIPIYGDFYNHAKGVVSELSSIIFTANIDGNHGLKSGFEVGKILEESDSKELYRFIDWQCMNAPLKYVKKPLKEEYSEYESFKEKTKNMKPPSLVFRDVFKVRLDNKSIFSQLEKHPSYLKFYFKKVVGIRIGSKEYVCTEDQGLFIIGKTNSFFNNPEYYLRFNRIELVI